MDEWGCFPHERQRLFDLIQDTRATGVILLSGNVHFTEISRVETESYPLFDFTSSGLTHINEKYAEADNKYRIAGPSAELNFGLIEIDWKAKPSPVVALMAVGANGTTDFEMEVRLDDLQ